MNINSLKQFIVEANQSGYASGEKITINESDGSKTIKYENQEWKMVDNYVGGEPYSGMTKIFFNDKIVWSMVYYGKVADEINVFGEVYEFLKKALLKMPSDFPFRGPKEFVEGNWKYINDWNGEVEQFSGEEKIYLDDKVIFWTKYLGGVVDERSE